ncbi:MAG: hypothetical protein IJX80_10970 [Clostridia bacterium]|nr:hypothetical protein [Clostridia bacterium]
MELVIEFFAEILFEAFFEGFIALSAVFMPNKILSPKVHRILKVLCCLIAVALLILLVVGVFLLAASQGESILGWIFVGVGAGYVILAIVLKIVSEIRK